MNKLQALLAPYFNPIAIEDIVGHFNLIRFDRSKLILSAQQTAHYLYFIETGLLRSFYSSDLGIEHTFEFYGEGEFVTILDSFLYKRHSTFSIECLTAATLWSISKDQLDALLLKYPTLRDFRFDLLAIHTQKSVDRSVFNQLPTALDRFQALLVRYPAILNQCKKKHIASYLKLTKESFSRLIS